MTTAHTATQSALSRKNALKAVVRELEATKAQRDDLVKALKEARSMVAYSASGMTHSMQMTQHAQVTLTVVDNALAKVGAA